MEERYHISALTIVFYSAYAIDKEAINPLLGEAPSKETIKEIERHANAYEGVLGVHDSVYHKYPSPEGPVLV